jgi:hypothetical protein
VVLYATALLAGAVGLHRLGRTNRRDPGWPQSQVPRFYTGMALVAAGASTLLPVGELLGRHHRPLETAVLVTVIVVAVLTLGWLATRFHEPRYDVTESIP